MNQGNEYRQYGYDHYNKPPTAGDTQRNSLFRKILGERVSTKMRSPVFATAALLITAAAFAGIIMVSYPGNSDKEAVPVIKADITAFKEIPEDHGGMIVPNRDSSIFTTMADKSLEEFAPVENLLDKEQPVDKLEVFAKEVETIIQEDKYAQASAKAQDEQAIQEITAVKAKQLTSSRESRQDILQKIDAISSRNATNTRPAPVARKPGRIHAAGSSPETLAFVRSVLEKKDTRQLLAVNTVNETPTESIASNDIATTLAAIEPATGAAIATGSFFVQLGSVTSEAGANSEWKRLQKSFSSQLQGISYRVQRADLGERGIYYRIQAGPMAKQSAGDICNSIKVQKPGGCLVTK